MKLFVQLITTVSFFSVFLIRLSDVDACNEAVCASIVSKCLITEDCLCNLVNCTCCKACFQCLGTLYAECCSCVDMCPKPNNTKVPLNKQSLVEELIDPIPSLFRTLISNTDSQDRWLSLTFPIDITRTEVKKDPGSEQQVYPDEDIITFNCSVAYMNQCMTGTKCKETCLSMGAQSYRWFHHGCCECIGDKCINFGLNESRCSQCLDEEPVESIDYARATYGEDEDDEIQSDIP